MQFQKRGLGGLALTTGKGLDCEETSAGERVFSAIGAFGVAGDFTKHAGNAAEIASSALVGSRLAKDADNIADISPLTNKLKSGGKLGKTSKRLRASSDVADRSYDFAHNQRRTVGNTADTDSSNCFIADTGVQMFDEGSGVCFAIAAGIAGLDHRCRAARTASSRG